MIAGYCANNMRILLSLADSDRVIGTYIAHADSEKSTLKTVIKYAPLLSTFCESIAASGMHANSIAGRK